MRAPIRFFPSPHATVGVIVLLAAGTLFFVGLHWVFWVVVALFVIDVSFDALTGRRR
jgi:hypothetical protein